jgi:predicted RecA/RadA family phage recombinase
LETTQEEFFKEFFKDGGKYSKYVTLVNNGAIAAGDVMKVGKEYKVGVIVSVNTAGLRKDLEQAGIIKALTNGF